MKCKNYSNFQKDWGGTFERRLTSLAGPKNIKKGAMGTVSSQGISL